MQEGAGSKGKEETLREGKEVEQKRRNAREGKRFGKGAREGSSKSKIKSQSKQKKKSQPPHLLSIQVSSAELRSMSSY
uniref:hypothetical protein 48 n=1 Tax=Moniliophthora perniciosa TaxID=153609 RepID=UPI000024235D|nr:hypothetical protein 48 [Moniliophthora perniciosa]AAQ74343.1 hypothetical protein 48 [Moniliophthora perniciosa]